LVLDFALCPSPANPILFGVAGVQMSVSAFEDHVDRMGAYLWHIRVRFPWRASRIVRS